MAGINGSLCLWLMIMNKNKYLWIAMNQYNLKSLYNNAMAAKESPNQFNKLNFFLEGKKIWAFWQSIAVPHSVYWSNLLIYKRIWREFEFFSWSYWTFLLVLKSAIHYFGMEKILKVQSMNHLSRNVRKNTDIQA